MKEGSTVINSTDIRPDRVSIIEKTNNGSLKNDDGKLENARNAKNDLF